MIKLTTLKGYIQSTMIKPTQLRLKTLRLSFLVFAIFYGLFAFSDSNAFPEIWPIVMSVRLGFIVPLFLIIIAFSYRADFYRWHQLLVSLAFFISGVFLIHLYVLGPDRYLYNGAIFLVYVAGYFMVQLKRLSAAMAGLGILVVYLFVLIIYQPIIDDVLIVQIVYLLGMNIFGILGVTYLDQYERERLHFENTLELKNKDLLAANDLKQKQIQKLHKVLEEKANLQKSYEDVTFALKKLNRLEQRYRSFVKQTRAFVYELDMKGQYTYVSDSIEEILDYTPEEILYQKYFYDFFPEDLREKFQQEAMLVMEKGESIREFINPLVTRYGDVVWVSSYLDPQRDDQGNVIGYYGCDMDITQRKTAEEDRVVFKTIADESLYGSAISDLEGNLLYVNEAFCQMHGFEADELIGKSLSILYTEEQLQIVYPLLEKMRQKGGFESEEVWHLNKNGSEFPTLMTGKMITVEGEAKYFSATMLDLSAQVNLQQELEETANALERARSHLKQILDNLPIGVGVAQLKPELTLSYVNNQFAKILLTSKEAIMSTEDVWSLVFEDEQDRLQIYDKIMREIQGEENSQYWEDVPIRKSGKKTHYVTFQNIKLPDTNAFIMTAIDVTERKHREEEILHISYHDYLTGLPNRRYYQESLVRFEDAIYQPLGIVVMDLDGLKLINDAFGHDIGNQALIEVSQTLKACIKLQQHVLARVGGDEFVLLVPNAKENDLHYVISCIQESIKSIKIKDIHLSISAGFAIHHENEKPLEQIVIDAENNMYKNKVFTSNTSRNDAIRSILETLQNKYLDEKEHSNRVSAWCVAVGKTMKLRPEALNELAMAGLYHDIGKITIPDDILKKPGPLSESEWEIMKKHTISGYQILRAADRYSNLAEYALTHHERFDGTGYPNQLRGEVIPLYSRIISVVDAYEAMTSDRPYRKALPKTEALAELKKHQGTQFDPTVVDAFIKVLEKNKRSSS